MKNLSLKLLIGLAAVPLVASAGFMDFIFGHRDINVITVTDMTPEGRLRPAVSPSAPVYYLPVSLGFRDFGGVIAGDKIPPKEEAIRTITKVLAEQGYLPVTETSPTPSIVLVMTWGTLNADLEYGSSPESPPRQTNRQQILKFLGGYKMGFSDNDFDPLTAPITGLSAMNYESRDFYELAEDDFFVAVVSAYDLQSIQQKNRKMLWMTRISCPSRGFWLSEVLPTMLSIAGPSIGRETAKPIWVNASDKFKPEVKIGDLQLKEYLDNATLPVIEAKDKKK